MRKYLTIVNKENKIKPNYLKNIKLVTLKDIDKEDTLLEEETAKSYKKLRDFLRKKGIIGGV